MLYRLAVSPGSRALQGMPARRGRLVRPLLTATRDEVRAYLRARELEWREDPTNADRRFARPRVRHDVLPSLRELSPVAERTIAETARQLREEAEVLERAVDDALEGAGGGPAVTLAALREQPAAVRRLLLRRLAERAAGGREARALSRAEAEEIMALGDRGTRSLDLGGGLRAVAEYGVVRFVRGPEPEAVAAVELPVPGRARFGDWEIEALPGPGGEVTVTGVGSLLVVRPWRDGDRMRPLGLGGSKSLQDLFTDRKVPRALRRTLPVVEAEGEIVWVAGRGRGRALRGRAGDGRRRWDWRRGRCAEGFAGTRRAPWGSGAGEVVEPGALRSAARSRPECGFRKASYARLLEATPSRPRLGCNNAATRATAARQRSAGYCWVVVADVSAAVRG